MSEDNANCIINTYDASLQSLLQYPAAQIHDFGFLSSGLLSKNKCMNIKTVTELFATECKAIDFLSNQCSKYAIVSRYHGTLVPLLGTGDLYTKFATDEAYAPRAREHGNTKQLDVNGEEMCWTGFQAWASTGGYLYVMPIGEEQTSIDGTNSNNSLTHTEAVDENTFEIDLATEVREVFSRLSGVAKTDIERQTTIFQLGLDSINAVQIAVYLRRKGKRITAAAVFQNPSIEELVQYYRDTTSQADEIKTNYNFAAFETEFWLGASDEYIRIRSEVESVRPCTALQEGLLSQFINSNGHKYFNQIEYHFPTDITTDKLLQAWEDVVSYHAILRTGFVSLSHTDFCFAMITYKAGFYSSAIDRCEDKASFASKQKFHNESAKDVLRRLHVSAWRARLMSTSEGIRLQLSLLHALYDAQSLQIVLDDIIAACYGKPLSPTTTFDRLLSNLLLSASSHNDDAKSYWTKHSNQIVVNSFPVMTKTRKPLAEPYTVHLQHSQSTAVLEKACREANITVQAAGQTAWAHLIASYIGVEDVTFGVILSDRTDEGDQEVAFPCIATVPMFCNVQKSNMDMLQDVMAKLQKIQKYQQIPITKIQKWIGRPGEPLFDTVFVYQKLPRVRSKAWEIVDENAVTEVWCWLDMESLTC